MDSLDETFDVIESSREWMRLSECGDFPQPDVFFEEKDDPDRKTSRQIAKLLCSICVVKDDCLNYALNHAVVGVWGGTTARERKQIRQELGIPSPMHESLVRGAKNLGDLMKDKSREWEG